MTQSVLALQKDYFMNGFQPHALSSTLQVQLSHSVVDVQDALDVQDAHDANAPDEHDYQDAHDATFHVQAWNNSTTTLSDHATHYGIVHDDEAILTCWQGTFTLNQGMYFSVVGAATISGNGQGLTISQCGFLGFFQIGGPAEEIGRLKYIDGCSDSLIIPPVLLGDACLNLLHIPPHTPQSQHTHPSFRVGLILSGQGICRTPEADHPLKPGVAFVIPANSLHSFHTQDQALRVIAFHPDSDYGPQHENHPMINKTILPAPLTTGASK